MQESRGLKNRLIIPVLVLLCSQACQVKQTTESALGVVFVDKAPAIQTLHDLNNEDINLSGDDFDRFRNASASLINLHEGNRDAAKDSQKITIVGAGPVGLATALLAYKNGLSVSLVEKRKNYVRINNVLTNSYSEYLSLDGDIQTEEHISAVKDSSKIRGSLIGALPIKDLENTLASQIHTIVEHERYNGGLDLYYGYEFVDMVKNGNDVDVLLKKTFGREGLDVVFKLRTGNLVAADGARNAVSDKVASVLKISDLPLNIDTSPFSFPPKKQKADYFIQLFFRTPDNWINCHDDSYAAQDALLIKSQEQSYIAFRVSIHDYSLIQSFNVQSADTDPTDSAGRRLNLASKLLRKAISEVVADQVNNQCVQGEPLPPLQLDKMVPDRLITPSKTNYTNFIEIKAKATKPASYVQEAKFFYGIVGDARAPPHFYSGSGIGKGIGYSFNLAKFLSENIDRLNSAVTGSFNQDEIEILAVKMKDYFFWFPFINPPVPNIPELKSWIAGS